ncbi:hypothetical protein ACLOJK_007088 [Asimina triloba]
MGHDRRPFECCLETHPSRDRLGKRKMVVECTDVQVGSSLSTRKMGFATRMELMENDVAELARRWSIWVAALDWFSIYCRRAAVDAMLGEKKPLELDVEAALVGCIGSNGLLVGRDGFSPDLKRKKMATIADGDVAAVHFKQMLSISAGQSARRKKKAPTIAARFATLLVGFLNRRRWGCWICTTT